LGQAARWGGDIVADFRAVHTRGDRIDADVVFGYFDGSDLVIILIACFGRGVSYRSYFREFRSKAGRRRGVD